MGVPVISLQNLPPSQPHVLARENGPGKSRITSTASKRGHNFFDHADEKKYHETQQLDETLWDKPALGAGFGPRPSN